MQEETERETDHSFMVKSTYLPIVGVSTISVCGKVILAFCRDAKLHSSDLQYWLYVDGVEPWRFSLGIPTRHAAFDEEKNMSGSWQNLFSRECKLNIFSNACAKTDASSYDVIWHHHIFDSKESKEAKKGLIRIRGRNEAEKGLRRIRQQNQESPDFYRRLTNQTTTTTEKATLWLLLWFQNIILAPTINYKL
jgi:hypothetical protein